MHDWRKVRAGNTGIAITESSPAARWARYLPSPNSETCHSRYWLNRALISGGSSGIGRSRMPGTGIRPVTRSRVWS